jgi:hypothetical protein
MARAMAYLVACRNHTRHRRGGPSGTADMARTLADPTMSSPWRTSSPATGPMVG